MSAAFRHLQTLRESRQRAKSLKAAPKGGSLRGLMADTLKRHSRNYDQAKKGC
jgi:hypothetical protein